MILSFSSSSFLCGVANKKKQLLGFVLATVMMMPWTADAAASSFLFVVAFPGFSCGNWNACEEHRRGWKQVCTREAICQTCSERHKRCTEFWGPEDLFSIVVFSASGNVCIAARLLLLLHPAAAAGMAISCFALFCESCRIATPPLPLQRLLLHRHLLLRLLRLLLHSIRVELLLQIFSLNHHMTLS